MKMKNKDVYIFSTELIALMPVLYDADDIATVLGCDQDQDHGPLVLDPYCWFRVAWPEHVLRPRYNSDADYYPVDANEIENDSVHSDSIHRI